MEMTSEFATQMGGVAVVLGGFIMLVGILGLIRGTTSTGRGFARRELSGTLARVVSGIQTLTGAIQIGFGLLVLLRVVIPTTVSGLIVIVGGGLGVYVMRFLAARTVKSDMH